MNKKYISDFTIGLYVGNQQCAEHLRKQFYKHTELQDNLTKLSLVVPIGSVNDPELYRDRNYRHPEIVKAHKVFDTNHDRILNSILFTSPTTDQIAFKLNELARPFGPTLDCIELNTPFPRLAEIQDVRTGKFFKHTGRKIALHVKMQDFLGNDGVYNFSETFNKYGHNINHFILHIDTESGRVAPSVLKSYLDTIQKKINKDYFTVALASSCTTVEFLDYQGLMLAYRLNLHAGSSSDALHSDVLKEYFNTAEKIYYSKN